MRAKQFTTEAAIGTNPKRPSREGSRPERGHEPQKRYVTDRKTGKQYDPEEEFDKLKNSDEFQAQMKRMAQKEGVAEAGIDRPGMKDGRPYSDPYRRHPGNSSYMTPEYLIQKYKERLAQIAAGPYKRPKEVAQLQSRIAKLEKQGVAEGFDYTMKDLGNDFSGFPSNHSLKHKMMKRISPEHHQLYKDKINNTHDSDQLVKLFHVAKARGHVIDEGVAEGSLNEFAPDGFNGGDDGEEFNPNLAKMAYDEGVVKGASLADGATLQRAMAINDWDKHDGGIYSQHFAKGFKKGRLDKIRHNNKQYNLNLQLMKDGSIRHGEQGVAEGSDSSGWIGNPAKWKEAVLQAHGDDVVFKNYSHPGQPGKRSVNAWDANGKIVGVYQRHNKMGMVQPNMQGVAEGTSDAMANAAKRLTDPNDGKTAKLRAAGDKRREEHLKSRDIAKKNEAIDRMAAELEEAKAPRALCKSSTPDEDLGASQLSSCKSQGLRARDGNKSHKLGKSSKSRVKVGGKRIKGNKYGGPLPDWS